ncbi:MAG: hypothetical protein CMJ49_06410 [Planctomycetaceae bacterium]|nr:hypothetical protein [Planctomycetaceae bacterium]
MSVLRRLHAVLRRSDLSLADNALLDALPTARAPHSQLILETLFDRARPAAMTGIVDRFHLLGRAEQSVVLDRTDDLLPGLERAARAQQSESPSNVVRIIEQSRLLPATLVLADLLRHTDAGVARAAASTLLDFARRLVRPDPDTDRDAQIVVRRAQDADWLTRALAEAAAGFHHHRRRDVLYAALMLLRRNDPHLIDALTNRAGAALAVLTALITSPEAGVVRAALLPCAAHPPLQASVASALADLRIAASLDGLLNDAHLLAVPQIARTVERVRRIDHLTPLDTTWQTVAPSALPHVGRWVRALSCRHADASGAVERLILHRDRVIRLSGLRALMHIDSDAADQMIATMCFDAEPTLARIALRHLSRRNWSHLPRLMLRLAGSTNTELRRLAEHHFGSYGFTRFWDAWPDLPNDVRRTAGRALMKIDPRFHHQLAERFNASDPRDRLRCVMVVRTIGQPTYYESQLLAMLEDADNRVASAAAAALAAFQDSPRAADALSRAMHHNSPRVRANAVEALERMGRLESVRQSLIQMLDDANNRSRANATKALNRLSAHEARQSLARMMGDRDAAHRISALWVFEQTAAAALAPQVGAMAKTDREPGVRSRALTVLRRMVDVQRKKQSAAIVKPKAAAAMIG